MTTSVLVLGAGFGGLELSSRLAHELGDDVAVTLIDRSGAFVFGFSKLDVMFGKKDVDAVRLPFTELTTPRVRFRQETIIAIDPEARRVTTDLETYEADVLVVALGADYDLAATPGLADAGNEFYSVEAPGAPGPTSASPRGLRSSAVRPRVQVPARAQQAVTCSMSSCEGAACATRLRFIVVPFGAPVLSRPRRPRRS
jgi:sulfide:quinone oxidoreductase